MKIKKRELVSSAKANITIKDEKGENIGRLLCPHAVLSYLFQAIASIPKCNIEKNTDNLSLTIMGETVLNVSHLSCQVTMGDEIVKSIELGGT